MRRVSIRKPASQALPIEVRFADARHHTDLEVVNRALAATGETRDRLTSTRVQRFEDSDDAIVFLYRD
jgi:hypothetical protein